MILKYIAPNIAIKQTIRYSPPNSIGKFNEAINPINPPIPTTQQTTVVFVTNHFTTCNASTMKKTLAATPTATLITKTFHNLSFIT